MTTAGAATTALPSAVTRLLETRMPTVAGRIRWHARSGTKVDTGAWLFRAPLHVIVGDDRLALVATGPRPVVVEMPLQAIGRAVYNHVTGEIVFPRTAASAPAPPLRLDPLVAHELFAIAPAPHDPLPSSGTLSHA